MMHRRRKRQIVFAGFLAVIAVVNILFFLILLRPARSDYFNLQGSIDQLRGQIAISHQALARLSKTSEQLEKFEQDRSELFNSHFIKFDPGFAELSPRLVQMAVQSGVLRPVVDFSRDEIKQYGLYSVKIKIPVQGSYSNAINFIKDLETTDTFFVIDSIDVRSNTDSGPVPTAAFGNTAVQANNANNANNANSANSAGGNGSVALSLSLETFFYK